MVPTGKRLHFANRPGKSFPLPYCFLAPNVIGILAVWYNKLTGTVSKSLKGKAAKMFALSDRVRKDSMERGKKAKVKFIKRRLINFWLPSPKGWCDCYSAGTSVCHRIISTSVMEAGQKWLVSFLRRLGIALLLFPEVEVHK